MEVGREATCLESAKMQKRPNIPEGRKLTVREPHIVGLPVSSRRL